MPHSPETPLAINQALDHVNKHIARQLLASLIAANDKVDGHGCTCPNCLKSAVEEVNSWINLVIPDENDRQQLNYTIESSRQGIKIVTPPNNIGRILSMPKPTPPSI